MLMQVALVKFSLSQNENRNKTKETERRPVRRTHSEGGDGLRKD